MHFDVPSRSNGMTPTEAVTDSLERTEPARREFEPYKHLDATRRIRREKREHFINEFRELEIHLSMLEENENDDRPVTGVPRIKKKNLDNAWAIYRVAIQWLDLELKFQNAQVRLTNAQTVDSTRSTQISR